jgi:indolepyruvate ferredoxin oxidoreductase alpha subunit
MNNILEKPGKKTILLGNEAICRGALESGVNFVSTYPGTPASEIGDVFSRIARDSGVYMEYSVNEKVALEAGIGASFSGLKVLVAMKHFGLNVCSDSLMPFCYTGSKGPFVLLVADDPSCWSSAQSEQNSRAFAYLAHIPILEPSDPQECKDFIKLAFEISEKFKIPVMVRTTTRVAHQSSPVILEEIKKEKKEGKFVKNPEQFSTMPPRVLEMKKELLEKIKKIKEFSEKSKINSISNQQLTINNQHLGVITSGISYLYVMEALKELNLSLPVLKLGFFYPLSEKKIKNFIKKLKKILIVEELEPYLEKEVERLAKDSNPKLQIFGKSHLSEIGELKPEDAMLAISQITRKKTEIDFKKHLKKFQEIILPKRYPQLCTADVAPPGCPYWLVFSAIKKAAPENAVFGGDIGCYMIAANPPHFLQDYLLSMGASIGIAHGIARSAKQKVITLIGDSTFFHAGIPALINAVFNKSNPLIIILDNRTAAMTGHQPEPGASIRINAEYQLEPEEGKIPSIKIEDIVQACGVKNLKAIDPQNFEELTSTIKEFLEKEEVSVIIARRICALLAKRIKK